MSLVMNDAGDVNFANGQATRKMFCGTWRETKKKDGHGNGGRGSHND